MLSYVISRQSIQSRVTKLVFLDAAYDRASPLWKSINKQNPLRDIQIPEANDSHYSIEEHVTAMNRYYPFWANIRCEAVNEDFLHIMKKDTNGKIIYKMPYSVNKALIETMDHYTPEDSKIQAPVLSIYALKGTDYYVSLDYLTKKEKELVIRYFDRIKHPLQRQLIEQFRRNVPHARIVEIPHGHHYCFIKHKELVLQEMKKFLYD